MEKTARARIMAAMAAGLAGAGPGLPVNAPGLLVGWIKRLHGFQPHYRRNRHTQQSVCPKKTPQGPEDHQRLAKAQAKRERKALLCNF